MQIDLAQHEPCEQPFRSQICIVGAGIAGLTLAHSLSQRGIDVALLEAGGLTLEGQSQGLVAAAQLSGQPHLGTKEGRFHAFGGASLRWGGQLLPMPADDQSSPPDGDPWPIPASTLDPFYPAAEKLLGVDGLSYDALAFFSAIQAELPPLLKQFKQLNPRLSKWTPFAQRNLANTIGRDLLTHPRVTVYLHAQVTELLLAPTRTHLEAALVRTRAGHTFRFEAAHFALAAGTVETSRLLLASRSVAPEGVGNAQDQVGRNFHDHLTLPAATITGQARTFLLREFRPWLVGSTLHSIKLEATSALRRQFSLNPVVAHFTLNEPEDSGVAVIREVLTARQRGNFAANLGSHALKLPSAALAAARLAWTARKHRRRYVSAKAEVILQINAAQDALSASRITLSSALDPFGLPQPIVDWRISASEIATLRNFAAHLRARFDRNGLWNKFEWLPALLNSDLELTGLVTDARHAMGGACMGTDPRTSVVSPGLTVHGIPNLHIASAATFPTGSPQLITLPLMALTLRLADRLISLLNS